MKREASEEIFKTGGGRAVQKIRHNSLRYSTLTHLPFAKQFCRLAVIWPCGQHCKLLSEPQNTISSSMPTGVASRCKQHPFVFCHELPKLLITSNHMLKNVFMRPCVKVGVSRSGNLHVPAAHWLNSWCFCCNVFSWRIWRLRSLVSFCEHRSFFFEARSRSCSGLGKCRLHGKD